MDGYLKFEGIDGECHDSEHLRWIDVRGFSWGGTQEAVITPAGAVGPGIPSVGPVTFSQDLNKASPAMFVACATGRLFESVLFHAVVPGTSRLVLMKVQLKGCLITGMTTQSAEEKITESVSMVYQSIFTDVVERRP